MPQLYNQTAVRSVAQTFSGLVGDGRASWVRVYSHASYTAGVANPNTGILYVGFSATNLPIAIPTGLVSAAYVDLSIPPPTRLDLTSLYFLGRETNEGATLVYLP